jgi:hypothetical protein
MYVLGGCPNVSILIPKAQADEKKTPFSSNVDGPVLYVLYCMDSAGMDGARGTRLKTDDDVGGPRGGPFKFT